MRRPRHQARQGGDHPRHPQRRRGGPQGPRRLGHRPHRRRGPPRRHPRRQDHPQGRDPALPRGEAAPRDLRREGRRRARQLAQGPPGRGRHRHQRPRLLPQGHREGRARPRHRGPGARPHRAHPRRGDQDPPRLVLPPRARDPHRQDHQREAGGRQGQGPPPEGRAHHRGRAHRDPPQVLGRDPGRGDGAGAADPPRPGGAGRALAKSTSATRSSACRRATSCRRA